MVDDSGSPTGGPGVVGYSDPFSALAGGTVHFHVSSEFAEDVAFEVDVVRLISADLQDGGAGLVEEPTSIVASISAGVATQHEIDFGSRCVIPPTSHLAGLAAFTAQAVIYPTALPSSPPPRVLAPPPSRGDLPRAVLGTWNETKRAGFALFLTSDGRPALILGDGRGAVAELTCTTPVRPLRWVRLTAMYDGLSGTATIVQDPIGLVGASYADAAGRVITTERIGPIELPAEPMQLTIGAWCRNSTNGDAAYAAPFDGKIEAPRLVGASTLVDDVSRLADPALTDWPQLIGTWDFAGTPGSRDIVDMSGNHLTGRLENLPTRGVTGSRWDGSQHDWRQAPSHYAAIHFHSDDLFDADWPIAFAVTIPTDAPSGMYVCRLETDSGTERISFFVSASGSRARSDVAFLASTATYLAYANFNDPHVYFADERERPSDPRLRVAAERWGGGCYHTHADGSGVHHSSHLRPLMNLRPRHHLWGFNADTLVTGWLHHEGVETDLITDHQLHSDGSELLDGYRVLVTGTHPEYWSTRMHDALVEFLERGGRLMYLGGNGFYWRVAFSSEWRGAIEVRRAEDGTRTWESTPGEYHHAFTGELGGLWRRVGRPPNSVAGVGFAAQGWGESVGYARQDASYDPRVAFVFEGVHETHIGTAGRVGGAAGEEIDRHDISLGSPLHSVVLARARGFGPEMVKTKEDFVMSIAPTPSDPEVCADLVFFETSAGGAVFSVGSIAWAGSLAMYGYDNDVARITSNVLTRFMHEQNFELP
jgi:N,N-dimethylformamidase